jgi:16S rRNA (cytosine1402-N4)-methyltransferase
MKNIPPQQLHTSSSSEDETTIHIPVLLEDTIKLLAPQAGESYLDLTAGYGGHASRIIDVIGANNATLVDRDQRAIDHLKIYEDQGASLVKSHFAA